MKTPAIIAIVKRDKGWNKRSFEENFRKAFESIIQLEFIDSEEFLFRCVLAGASGSDLSRLLLAVAHALPQLNQQNRASSMVTCRTRDLSGVSLRHFFCVHVWKSSAREKFFAHLRLSIIQFSGCLDYRAREREIYDVPRRCE